MKKLFVLMLVIVLCVPAFGLCEARTSSVNAGKKAVEVVDSLMRLEITYAEAKEWLNTCELVTTTYWQGDDGYIAGLIKCITVYFGRLKRTSASPTWTA